MLERVATMSVRTNAYSLVSNSALRQAYLRWVSAKVTGRRGPLLQMTGGIHLGPRWNSFSEYWTTSRVDWSQERLFLGRLRRRLDNSPIALDVGANVGGFTMLLIGCGFNKVHLFEPVPSTAGILKDNLHCQGLADRVVVNECAVSDATGIVKFWVDPKYSALCRMVTTSEGVSGTPTRSVTIDDYMSLNAIGQVDLLKVDTEGFELLVFRGAEHALRRKLIHVILFEVCPYYLDHHGFEAADLTNLLSGSGYSIWALGAEGQLACRADVGTLRRAECQNFVALHDDDLALSLSC